MVVGGVPARSKDRDNLVFAALANPDRRKILDLRRDGERPAGDLVAAFPGLPQPAVSRHLRTLREAGLVVASPRAQKRLYSLEPSKLREVDAWVSRYREFWPVKLDALSSHLEGADKAQGRGEER